MEGTFFRDFLSTVGDRFEKNLVFSGKKWKKKKQWTKHKKTQHKTPRIILSDFHRFLGDFKKIQKKIVDWWGGGGGSFEISCSTVGM